MSKCIHRNPAPPDPAKPVAVKHCELAEKDHREEFRVYAHTFHRKNVICVCSAFNSLPDTWRLAILLHEVGHLLAGQRASEASANEAVRKVSGIRITYKTGPYGDGLEWIAPNKKRRAREFLGSGK